METVRLSYAYYPESSGSSKNVQIAVSDDAIVLTDLLDHINQFIRDAGWVPPRKDMKLGWVNDPYEFNVG